MTSRSCSPQRQVCGIGVLWNCFNFHGALSQVSVRREASMTGKSCGEQRSIATGS